MKQAINLLPILPYTPDSHDRVEIKPNRYLDRRCFFTTCFQGMSGWLDNAASMVAGLAVLANCAAAIARVVESSACNWITIA
jgi:hypothetical protein